MDGMLREGRRYGVAFGAVAVAVAIHTPSERWLGPGCYSYLAFLLSATCTAWYVGLGPGLVATALGAVFGTWLFAWSGSDLAALAFSLPLYLVAATAIVALIHSRSRACERAKEQAHWLSVTLASLGEGVIAADLQGRVTFLNARAEALTGWPRDEAIGRSLDDFYRVEPGIEGSALVCRDGVRRPVEGTATPIRDERGDQLGSVVVIRDNTERIAQERARRCVDALYRALVESDLFGVAYGGLDGKIAFANEAFLRMVGRSRDAIDRGQLGWADLLPASEHEAGEPIVWPERSPFEASLEHEGGGRIRVLVGAQRLPATADHGELILAFCLDRTEHQEALEILGRYRLLSQYSRDIVLLFQSDGRLVEANEAAVAAYGHDRDALLNLTIHDLRDPATLRELPTQMARAEQGITFETNHRRRDGSIFPVEVSARGATIGGERLLLSIVRDISDRKAADREMEAQRARLDEILAQLEALVAGAPFALALLDHDLRFLQINEALAEIHGRSIADHMGRTLREVAPETADAIEPALREVIATGVPKLGQYHEGPIPGSLGSPGRWVGNWYPVRSPDGRVLGVGLMNVEITEQFRREEELRTSERRYQALTDAVRHLMWINDAEGRAVFFNRRWQEYAGQDSEMMTAASWTDIVHPEDLERIRSIRTAAIIAAEPYEYDYRILCRDGQHRWHVARVVPMFDGQGHVESWFGTATDIHDRKLVEDDLRAARDAAEAGTRARDQFLAVLSHELRNPLMPVLVSISALVDDSDTPEAIRPTLEMARRNIELEARLIDDLLDVTKITQGKLRLDPRPIDAREPIDRAIEICRDEIAAKRIVLKVEHVAAMSTVEADPARLQQIAWNLIKNAAKFTPAGGSITIRTANLDGLDGRPQLTLEVADTGLGIEGDALARIFDAFEQADPAISKQFGGLGLGLAISRSLAEAHDGRLEAESAGRGQGSRFRLVLPTIPATSLPNERTTVHGGGSDEIPSLRLLLVEDNPDSLRVLTRLLRRRGHQVTTAACLADARRAAAEATFDLLISDIGLPDGSGLDLIREIRDRIAIGGIALSGFGMEHDRNRSNGAGFLAHLTKPIDFSTLLATIREVIALRTD